MRKNSKHYRVNIDWSDEDKCFIARVPELPGCSTDGKTYIEAAKNIEEAIAAYLLTLKDLGKELPLAISERSFSGKIPLRIDPELHRDATAKAMIENLSLNQFIEKTLKKVI